MGGQLALLGFLPCEWSFIRDLFSRRAGRAIQKAYELLWWWRITDRSAHRRDLAKRLNETCDDEPDPTQLALLRYEGFRLPMQVFNHSANTRHVPGLAADEIVSGRGKHAHSPVPLPLRTSKDRLTLKDPLDSRELRRRDATKPLRLAHSTMVPAEMRLRLWLKHVCAPDPLHFEALHAGVGPASRCGCMEGEHS